MPVTLKQVAAVAGVSYQTVWRALHNGPGILPGTRARVLEAVRTLGYRADPAARGLRTNRSETIGVVVLDVSNAFTGRLVSGIQEAARERGLSMLLMNSGDDVLQERRAVEDLLARRVDGLIINPSALGDHAYLKQVIRPHIAVVAINREVPGYPCASIQSRHVDMALAVEYLAKQRKTRIGALFGSLENTPFRLRREAVRRSIRRLGLEARADWLVVSDNTIEHARETARRLISRPNRPEALVAAGNRQTEGILLACRDLGLRRGADLTVVGFDTSYAATLDPPLPTLYQPAREMGRRAVQMLSDVAISGRTNSEQLGMTFFNPDDVPGTSSPGDAASAKPCNAE